MSVPEPKNPAVEAYVRLQSLGIHLRAHGFSVAHVAGGLAVRNMTSSAKTCTGATGVTGDTIRCRPYEEDGGRYWFFTSWNQPIAEAERITDALVAIKGFLGAPV